MTPKDAVRRWEGDSCSRSPRIATLLALSFALLAGPGCTLQLIAPARVGPDGSSSQTSSGGGSHGVSPQLELRSPLFDLAVSVDSSTRVASVSNAPLGMPYTFAVYEDGTPASGLSCNQNPALFNIQGHTIHF